MRQSGRVAYLSDREARRTYGRGERVWVRFAGEPTIARDVAAVEEARRILGETEPDEPGTASFCIERLQGAGLDGKGRVYGFPGTYALAEALAAVLPVLDELEAQARMEAIVSTVVDAFKVPLA